MSYTITLTDYSNDDAIVDIYNDFVENIQSEDEIVLDFKNFERINMPLLQLILSGQHYARKENKMIKIKNTGSEVKKQLKILNLVK